MSKAKVSVFHQAQQFTFHHADPVDFFNFVLDYDTKPLPITRSQDRLAPFKKSFTASQFVI